MHLSSTLSPAISGFSGQSGASCGAGLAGEAVEGKTVPNQALTRAVLYIAETFRLAEMNFPAGRCLN